MATRTSNRALCRAGPALVVLACAAAGACAGIGSGPAADPATWWRGNLHTHSLWSDGGEFPELVAEWYRDRGYHFLAVTEHDRLQEGEFWIDINAPDEGWPPRNESARLALPGYRARFGADWVDERQDDDVHLVRLRALSEYRHLFEARDRFLLLMGEEVTDREGAHVNLIHVDSALQPLGGANPAERTRRNLAAAAELRRATRRPMLAVVNHPNYVWALTAADIAGIPEARFFEVYNGHLHVNNEGDEERPGTERMWDLILTERHKAGAPPIYGIAADDAHEFRAHGDTIARPGRGWVMVRAPRLTPDHLIAALEAGDFYATTGVTLETVERDERRIRIEVAEEPGVAYRIRFIGTRHAANENGQPVGEVLAEFDGPAGEYRFRGDERYVRATILSTADHIDPTTGRVLGSQRAWVQPVTR